MWLQPSFFQMRILHLGQARTARALPTDRSHARYDESFSPLQNQKRCASPRQRKQPTVAHLGQVKSSMVSQMMSSPQPGRGHQRALGFFSSCRHQSQSVGQSGASRPRSFTADNTYELALAHELDLRGRVAAGDQHEVALVNGRAALDHGAHELVLVHLSRLQLHGDVLPQTV
jgi:hypothetical protein